MLKKVNDSYLFREPTVDALVPSVRVFPYLITQPRAGRKERELCKPVRLTRPNC